MNDMWVGEKVRLRGVEPEDWEGFRDLAQNTVDVRSTDVVEPPRSGESFRSWTAERARRAPGGAAFRLVIEARADRAFAGSVTVAEIDSRAGRFMTGIEISRDHRRRGYAAEATELVLTYMFAEQRCNKCEVEVYAFNEASLALYASWGSPRRGGFASMNSSRAATTTSCCSASPQPNTGPRTSVPRCGDLVAW